MYDDPVDDAALLLSQIILFNWLFVSFYFYVAADSIEISD